MATITPYDYHTDIARHGEYQYFTLKKIVDDFMADIQDDDHILKNVRKFRVRQHVINGIKELNKSVLNDVMAMEIQVPLDLSWVLPHDYVDYIRVSVVVTDPLTGSFRLQPLNVNNNIHIAVGYLQDNDYEILFDQDGYILKANSSNAYAFPYKKYELNNFTYGGQSNNPTLDTTKLSKFGEFKIDERKGNIVFSSDLADKDIVMEYVSDGLSYLTYGETGEEVRVHKDAIETLRNLVYFTLIERMASVPQNEKDRALRRFKTTRHEAKINRSGFDMLEINRRMGLSSKNL